MSSTKGMPRETERDLRELVREAREGKRSSYEALLTRLAPILRKYATYQLSRFGRQNYAEDVAQEALLAIHLKLHTYDIELPFLAWARAIAHYKLIDYLRRMRMPTVSIKELEFFEPEDERNPEAAAINHDLQKLLGRLKTAGGCYYLFDESRRHLDRRACRQI